MTTGTGKLFEVEPREQVGAATGTLYEYQYHQAAAGALKLIEKTDTAVCVYCEWHDDYVLEGEADGHYTFYQVKTRGVGPWTIGEFFGLGRLNTKTGVRPLSKSKKSCIFSNLWDHTTKFGNLCHAFVFLSDVGLDTDLQTLLDEVKMSASTSGLGSQPRALFTSILSSVARRETNITEECFFDFLKKLRSELGIGSTKSVDDAKLVIVDRIVKASEVKLEWSEGRKMGTDLVTIVRSRSHLVLNSLPLTAEELRSLKGLAVTDVLKLLSLSEEGFRLLKEGAGDAVRTLSRLHRFCQKRSIPEDLIPQFCELKTRWSAWWLKHADLVDKADYTTFKSDRLELLGAHSGGTLSFRDLGNHTKGVATKYNLIFNPLEELKAENVMGFIISLAVEAER
jgi:hypothetical protein